MNPTAMEMDEQLDDLGRRESPRAAAFEARVAPHLPAMRGAAARLLRSPDLANDAVQDALSLIWRRHPDAEMTPRVLSRFVVLAALTILRQRRRCEQHEHHWCASSTHPHPEHEPTARLEQAELAGELRAVLDELPDNLREPFVRYCLEGHDYRCIASDLEIPIGTVRSRLHRARGLLRERLARTFDE